MVGVLATFFQEAGADVHKVDLSVLAPPRGVAGGLGVVVYFGPVHGQVDGQDGLQDFAGPQGDGGAGLPGGLVGLAGGRLGFDLHLLPHFLSWVIGFPLFHKGA